MGRRNCLVEEVKLFCVKSNISLEFFFGSFRDGGWGFESRGREEMRIGREEKRRGKGLWIWWV